MKIKELNDELGKGIGAYLDGKFFEVRKQRNLQSRIYGNNNDSNTIIIAEDRDTERAYDHFRTFSQRINHFFDIKIRNEKEDFIRYLDKGFEKEFGNGKIKVNLREEGAEELRKYAMKRAVKYGILTEALGWAGIASTGIDPRTAAIIGGFYFVFGDIVCGLVVPLLADLGRFTSPFFQIGAYPAERHFFKKYKFLGDSLLAYFKRKGAQLRNLEKKFEGTTNIRKKSLLARQLRKEKKRLANKWKPVELSFAKSEGLGMVIVGYKGKYQASFAFCNYMVNGIEPAEDDLDIWGLEVKKPPRPKEERGFDKVWEEEGEEKKEGK